MSSWKVARRDGCLFSPLPDARQRRRRRRVCVQIMTQNELARARFTLSTFYLRAACNILYLRQHARARGDKCFSRGNEIIEEPAAGGSCAITIRENYSSRHAESATIDGGGDGGGSGDREKERGRVKERRARARAHTHTHTSLPIISSPGAGFQLEDAVRSVVRDNRNDTAHNFGAGYWLPATLVVLEQEQ